MVRILAATLLLSLNLEAAPKKRFIIKYKQEKITKSSHFQKKIEVKTLSLKEALELKKDSSVEFIEEDTLLRAYLSPGQTGEEDPLYSKQWHYGTAPGAANLEAAWDLTTGKEDIVIAVLDTGILPHKDLFDRTLPGQDMISDSFIAQDGDGRDSDATDPGDFVTEADRCGFTSNSSWHGTHVAGTIGAITENGLGVSGVTWKSKILPVRVLGKCGGYTSDIADGILWAAGIKVGSLPLNPHPARVINLSLGGQGECGRYLQSAIDQATEKGALVVVAAGNSNQNMDNVQFSPASCQNVLTVGAANYDGERAYYSNYGKRVDLLAPGGENDYRILSTSNTGSTNAKDDAYVYQMGTSMASPHVAGVAGLVFAYNKELTPKEVKEILIKYTRSFDSKSNCFNTERCGQGLLDAYLALSSLETSLPPEQDPIEPAPEDPEDPSEPAPPTEDGHCGKTSDGSQSSSFFLSFLIGVVGTYFRKRK